MSREVAARVWGIFNTNQWQGYLALGVCFSLVRIILTSRILLFRFQMSTMLVGQIVRWCGTQRKTASTLGWSPTSPTLAKKNPAQVHSLCGGGRGGDRQLPECHRRPQPFCEAKSSAKDLRVSTEQLLVLVPRSPVCLFRFTCTCASCLLLGEQLRQEEDVRSELMRQHNLLQASSTFE